jgi:DNA-binding transcriptional LysR family regulator
MNRRTPFLPPSATLDIDVMRSVVAIAETGSVTGAAARVGRTPAALSMQLKKLEETLGSALFDRTRSGMTPTAEGERLLPHARRMIEAHRAAIEAFSYPELSGEVSVGIIDDFAGVSLTRSLAAFARSHSAVTVKVSMGPSAELAPRLDRGELDLAVLTPGCAVAWREGDRVLHEEPLCWVGLEGGNAFRERPLPLAISSQGCTWRKLALAGLDGAGIPWRIAYTSEFYAAQKAAIAADLAVAPLPRSLIEPGFVRLGKAEGMPEIGTARIALRVIGDSEPARVLGERIADSFAAQG